MCRVGGPRCSGSGRASRATLDRRKASRKFRREFAGFTEQIGDKALAKQVMATPPSAMGPLIHAAGLDHRAFTSSPLPTEQTGFELTGEQMLLADRLAEAYEGRDTLGMTREERVAAVGPLGKAAFNADEARAEASYEAEEYGHARLLTEPHYFGQRAADLRTDAEALLEEARAEKAAAEMITPRCDQCRVNVSGGASKCAVCGTGYCTPAEAKNKRDRCPECGKFVSKVVVGADDYMGYICDDCGEKSTDDVAEVTGSVREELIAAANTKRLDAHEMLQEAEVLDQMQATDDADLDATLTRGVSLAAEKEGLDAVRAELVEARKGKTGWDAELIDKQIAAVDALEKGQTPPADPQVAEAAQSRTTPDYAHKRFLDNLEEGALDRMSAYEAERDAAEERGDTVTALAAANLARGEQVVLDEIADERSRRARHTPMHAASDAIRDGDAERAAELLDTGAVLPSQRAGLEELAGRPVTPPPATVAEIERAYDEMLDNTGHLGNAYSDSAYVSYRQFAREERDEAVHDAARRDDAERADSDLGDGSTYAQALDQSQSLAPLLGLDRDVTGHDLSRGARKIESAVTNPTLDADTVTGLGDRPAAELAETMTGAADSIKRAFDPNLEQSLAQAEKIARQRGDTEAATALATAKHRARANSRDTALRDRAEALDRAAAALRSPTAPRADRHAALSLVPAAYRAHISSAKVREEMEFTADSGGKMVPAPGFGANPNSEGGNPTDPATGEPVLPAVLRRVTDTDREPSESDLYAVREAEDRGELRSALWNQIEALAEQEGVTDTSPAPRRGAVVALREEMDAVLAAARRDQDWNRVEWFSQNLRDKGRDFISLSGTPDYVDPGDSDQRLHDLYGRR